jgi:hypothetical protein
MKNGRRPPDWIAVEEGDETTEQAVDIERACSSLLAATPAYENPRCPLPAQSAARCRGMVVPLCFALFREPDGNLAFSMCDRD